MRMCESYQVPDQLAIASSSVMLAPEELMRVPVFLAAGLTLIFAFAVSVSPLAQAKTDEDYDTLMKAVGAANVAMRKASEAQMADGVSAEAKKLTTLFKDANGFWTSRKNTEAAKWASSAMTHAAE